MEAIYRIKQGLRIVKVGFPIIKLVYSRENQAPSRCGNTQGEYAATGGTV